MRLKKKEMYWSKQANIELLDVNYAEQTFFQLMVFIHTLFSHGTDPGHGDTDTQIITQLVSDWPPELRQCIFGVTDSNSETLVHEINSIINRL